MDRSARPEPLRALAALIRIRDVRVLGPDDLGVRDLVLADGKVLAIMEPGQKLAVWPGEIDEVDGSGKSVMPALVDIHCHPLGGGGRTGPQSQCDPLGAEEFARAGIGTVVGCLGYETSTRRPERLLAQVRMLTTHGFGAYMYIGEIIWPATTIAGALNRDIGLIAEIRGIKAAIAERDGGIAVLEQLLLAVSEATRGAQVAGQPPVLHLHVGQGRQRFELIEEALERDLVHPATITLTHVNWSEEMTRAAAPLAISGVNLDLTACIRPDYFPGAITPADALSILLEAEVASTRITISSDAGGSHINPRTRRPVRHRPGLLFEEMKQVTRSGELDEAATAALFTRNPARRLGLEGVGELAVGGDARLLMLDDGFETGRLMLPEGWRQEVVK